MLLARAAESLYWAARYLERAEDTARVIREHTNLIVDLPTVVPMTWAPLLAITGEEESFESHYQHTDEQSIVRFLVADRENRSSIVSAIGQARENLRTVRELVPNELWHAVNDLYLYIAGNNAEGVVRASRRRFLDRVISECQLVAGITSGTMSRSEPHAFIRLGTYIERGDMTTRVIDVNAATIGAQGEGAMHGNVQWASVLRSVAGLQMFRRSTQASATGSTVAAFLFADELFPRSVLFCAEQVSRSLRPLPQPAALSERCQVLRNLAQSIDVQPLDLGRLRKSVDDVQRASADLHDAVTAQYFAVGTAAFETEG
jgi:uncharacterized alpha-E superfamily protein